MDNNPSETPNNDINQQLSDMSTTIVSSLTTATPITSEIVSDFEPDPKFEITPLEMASYDCQDIYSTNLIEPHQQQPLGNNNGSGEVQNETQQRPEHLTQLEQVPTEQQQQPHDTLAPNPPQYQQSGANSSAMSQYHTNAESKPTVETQQQKQTDEKQISNQEVVINDCKSELAEKNITTSQAVVVPETSISHTQAELVVPRDSGSTEHLAQPVNKSDNETKTEGTSASIPVHQQLDFDINASLSVGDHAIKNSDTSHLFSLSQTSVDAQMEKVIDNIVELGGVHQFPQSLGHLEGREELFATIHREITGERSSIDLIADVASRQQSIEITPAIAPEQNTQVEDKVFKETATEKEAAEQMDVDQTETEEKIIEEPIIEEAVIEEPIVEEKVTMESVVDQKVSHKDESDRHVSHEHVTEKHVAREHPSEEHVSEERVAETPVTEEQVTEESVTGEQVAEEHVVEENLFNNSSEEKITEEKIAEEKIIEQTTEEVITEQKVTEQKVAKEEITDEQPTNEMVTAAGESITKECINGENSTDEKVTEDMVVDDKTGQEKETIAPEKASDDKASEQKITEKVTREKVTRAKVSEKKVAEKIPDETKNEEKISRPRRTRGKKVEEKVPEEPCPAPVKEQPKEDLIESAKHPVEHSTEQNSGEDSVQKTNVESIEPVERKERQSRSLRPRATLKRAHDDEAPKEDPPKVEPPKKQLKKSRGATSEQAPMIKLPNYRPRATISTSDPVTRLDKLFEPAPASTVQPESDKKFFVCHNCGYATVRLNNLVYHSTKSYCKGKLHMGEVMKADIIRQQQQAKNKRRSIR